MTTYYRKGTTIFLTVLSLLALLSLTAGSVLAKPPAPARTISDIETLGWVFIPNDLMVDGTLVGGLSGLVYSPEDNLYYALSDDKSEINDARWYSLTIDVSDYSLDDGDVEFLEATFLKNHFADRYGFEEIDPEGFAMRNPGQFFIGSEGDIAGSGSAPFIARMNPEGKLNRELPMPAYYLPTPAGFGLRDNLGFESLTVTPNEKYLIAGIENALAQDGPIASPALGSPSRLIQYRLGSLKPAAEYIYCVEPIPNSSGSGDNGLVELVALDDVGTLLAMERSFVPGFGNTIRFFQTTTQGATDVSGVDALSWEDCPDGDGSITPMSKTLLADFDTDLGVPTVEVLDNMEGMAFGPVLPDGRELLLVVSDNNFNPTYQDTIFVAFAVTLHEVD